MVKNNSNEDDAIPLRSNDNKKPSVSVLLCPAQFCVPVDYTEFLEDLQQELRSSTDDEIKLGSFKVAPLPRTEWIKVAKSLPTKEYLDATLDNAKTLSWYFDAMETALVEIFAEQDNNTNVCLIGHSIGGWVARAYLGGLSRSSSDVHALAQSKCTSLITLGTPNKSCEAQLVDQTRGLLRQVESSESCSPEALKERGITVTCVGSSGIQGSFLTTNLEEIVAASSYLPLVGNASSSGDGIVPTELAFLDEPANRVDVASTGDDVVRHAHVLPTPWNLWDGSAPSRPLPFTWYGSPSTIKAWAQHVR